MRLGIYSHIIEMKMMLYKMYFKIEDRQKIIDLTELKLKTSTDQNKAIDLDLQLSQLNTSSSSYM